MRKIAWLLPWLLIVLACWLFVGFERFNEEQSTYYELFLKQYPAVAAVYRNPVHPMGADVRELGELSRSDADEFKEFCRVRFGLGVPDCYAIYAESQRRADVRNQAGQ